MKTREIKGQVFNIENYAIHDGEGIRTLIFLKGCPLRCKWCANPEGLTNKPELIFSRQPCIGCGHCIDACPKDALSFRGKNIKIDRAKCDACGICVNVCYAEALELTGKEMTVGEVLEKIKKNIIFYKSSNGGVTLSGGEPLLQPFFAAGILKECKRENISTSIETCGYYESNAIEKVIDYLDYIFYDIKHIDCEKHRKLTGFSNEKILDNLIMLQTFNVDICVRIPIIPGINDDYENIKATAKMLSKMPKVKLIELLPYHKFGIHKYAYLDKEYTLKKILPPTKKNCLQLKEIFNNFNLPCIIG